MGGLVGVLTRALAGSGMSFCALRSQGAVLAAMVKVEADMVAEQGLKLVVTPTRATTRHRFALPWTAPPTKTTTLTPGYSRRHLIRTWCELLETAMAVGVAGPAFVIRHGTDVPDREALAYVG